MARECLEFNSKAMHLIDLYSIQEDLHYSCLTTNTRLFYCNPLHLLCRMDVEVFSLAIEPNRQQQIARCFARFLFC